tara:strand:- start:237 stop:578 length:342 start_codon:yes stop_codon:yes gene_type:complete
MRLIKMPTCINCDFKFKERQFDLGKKMCNKCLEKERYCMEVEFEVDPNGNGCDYNVLVDNSLEWLLEEFKEAKTRGFHTKLGSCPNIKILSVTDVLDGVEINLDEINLMLEEV